MGKKILYMITRVANRTQKLRIAVGSLFLFFLFLPFAYGQRTLDDHLTGLVYQAEDWSEPKDAWQLDKDHVNKWCLWTKEADVWQKRSKGKSLKTPYIMKDRTSPEEGAPALHTRITGIPNGNYNVYCNGNSRPLAFSFDGKKWIKGQINREISFGYFTIKDGTFEVWVDDRFVNPENKGPTYYDYIRFVPADAYPAISEIKAFTLPNGKTQISWISSVPTAAATVFYGPGEQRSQKVVESEDGLRNHAVVLDDLTQGQTCSAQIVSAINMSGVSLKHQITFLAGSRPKAGATQKTKIQLKVEEPTAQGRSNWPITSGVPFAKGVLADTNDICLRNEEGVLIPAQFDAFVRWPDGSIKWLVCDFHATTNAKKPVYYTLETGPEFGKNVPDPDPAFVQNAENDLNELFARLSSRIVLGDGSVLQSRSETMSPETKGSIRTTMKAEGDFLAPDGTPKFRWSCNLSRFASGLVRVQWGLENNIGNQLHTLVRSASLLFKNQEEKSDFTFSDGSRSKDLFVLQDLYQHAKIQKDGKENVQNYFDGFVSSKEGLWIRDFQQTWPKGLICDKNGKEVFLLPRLPNKDYPPQEAKNLDTALVLYYWYKDGYYQFKRGMQTLNEFWLFDGELASKDPAVFRDWLAHPLFAVADPVYYCETGVYPPVKPKRAGILEYYEDAFDKSFKRLEEFRQKRGEYGWMNFGDWYGERLWNWGNNEYDLSYVCSLHYIRSGRLDYLERGIEMARHYTTIDTMHDTETWSPNMRELVYLHCSGHVGDFLTKEDPRIQADLKNHPKTQWILEGRSDGSGGHCYQPGNFYIACLTGDKRVFETAEKICWNQAKRYTPNFIISIERVAGWSMINAVYAYNFTGNPYYLNAAKIYFEKIQETQNPKTGCFDLRQDQSECDCPDKKEHRGGKAFATGVLLHGLARFYEIDSDPQVKEVILGCVNWLLDTAWNEEKRGFRYKTGCSKYANSGWYTVIVTEGIAYASELTGDRRYVEFLERTLPPYLRPISWDSAGKGYGKDFSQTFRQVPHALYYMEKYGKMK